MKHPETQDEFERYIASRRGRYYINSREFAERCELLDERLATSLISVKDAAELVGLPINVFRHMLARHLTSVAAQSAVAALTAPASATVH